MKRIFTLVMIGILLVGCSKTDFLTDHEWIHYDSTCIETIYFGKDGHFSYYSDEGNPINDSDLYDQYTYEFKSKKNELFVHVDTTNTRINDFHRKSSFQNKEERSID